MLKRFRFEIIYGSAMLSNDNENPFISREVIICAGPTI